MQEEKDAKYDIEDTEKLCKNRKTKIQQDF